MIRAALLAAALILAAGPAAARAQLVLRDGSVIEGVSAQRKGDLFLLGQADGSISTIPAASVKELRLLDDPDAPPTGVKVAPPRNLTGPSPEPVTPATRAEQLAAFPEPKLVPRPAPIASEWTPTDAWAGRGGNQFRPARWYRAPIDATWAPVPAFTSGSDVTNFRPTRWTTVMQSIWVPRDGFADAPSNPRRQRAEDVKPEPEPD